jgi:hypothetical protein
LFYDPLEKNFSIIKKNICEIEEKLVEKQKKYQKVVKHLDYIKTAYKSVAYDQAKLLK